MIKSFQIDFIHETDEIDDLKNIEDDEIIISISFNQQNLSKNQNFAIDENNQSTNSSFVSSSKKSSSASKSTQNRRLSIKYQNFVDVIVLFQNEVVSSSFLKSQKEEINELLKKSCFKIVFIQSISEEVRIFNLRFVDEIKHEKMTAAFEKSRLIIQIYNDHDKTIVLTQTFIIQQINQRLILALIVSIDHNLYLRDISQIYVQSSISLNKQFYIRSSIELEITKNSILKIIKSLYEVLKTKTH